MENKKASDIVFDNIQEKILSGQWNPGTKITSEIQLAKELNVSRMSVREAIEKLVVLDILTRKPGEGTFVNELSPSVYLNSLIPKMMLSKDSYLDILEFRLGIEPQSARLCAQRCDEKVINKLDECYENMEKYRHDKERFTKEDMRFHMLISEGTGNSIIIKVNNIISNILEYHQNSLYEVLGPEGGIKEHKDILDAIKNKDPELSEIFIKRHIKRTIEDIKKVSYQQ